MGKYERKNRRPGAGRFERRRKEKNVGFGIVKLLIALAAVLAVAILALDGREPSADQPQTQTAPTQQVQIQQTQAVEAQTEAQSQPESSPSAQESRPTQSTEAQPLGENGEPVEQMTYMEMAQGSLVLVDGTYDVNYRLVDTVSLYDKASSAYHVEDVTLGVQECVVEPLNAWMEAFYAQSGSNDVMVSGGIRTGEDLPSGCGQPDHDSGLGVDLQTYTLGGSLDGEEFEDLAELAPEFGFVRRYPERDSDVTGVEGNEWHFRYVGLPHSDIMSTKSYCLEEYLEYLKEYPYDGNHLQVECQGVEYEVYYCEGLQIMLPTDREYTVSGNNVDGFIVTVKE